MKFCKTYLSLHQLIHQTIDAFSILKLFDVDATHLTLHKYRVSHKNVTNLKVALELK